MGPSLETEAFFLTYRRCSEMYTIIPMMVSLAFLAAILIDSDICRPGLAAAGSVSVAYKRILVYLCSNRKLLLDALPFA
jgi:hypothetical protein